MSVWVIAAVALLLIVLILRIIFKITGFIIKLLILAAVGIAIWWLFSGV